MTFTNKRRRRDDGEGDGIRTDSDVEDSGGDSRVSDSDSDANDVDLSKEEWHLTRDFSDDGGSDDEYSSNDSDGKFDESLDVEQKDQLEEMVQILVASSRLSSGDPLLSILNEEVASIRRFITSLPRIQVFWDGSTSTLVHKKKSITFFNAHRFFDQYLGDLEASKRTDELSSIYQELTLQNIIDRNNEESVKNHIFSWEKPSEILVNGGFSLGTSPSKSSINSINEFRGNPDLSTNIDLYMTLPDSFFSVADVFGHCYYFKRLLYLGVLVYCFKGHKSISWHLDTIYEVMHPCLKVPLHKTSGISYFILLKTGVDSHFLQRQNSDFLHLFRPDFYVYHFRYDPRSSIGAYSDRLFGFLDSSLDFSCRQLKDQSGADATPPRFLKKVTRLLNAIHNHHILCDLFAEQYAFLLNRELDQVFRDAALLANIWIAARKLHRPFNGFVVCMTFLCMKSTTALPCTEGIFGIFVSWLKFIAKNKFDQIAKSRKDEGHNIVETTMASESIYKQTPPPLWTLKTTSNTSSIDIFAKYFDCLLLDVDRCVNVFCHVTLDDWERLSSEAWNSIHALEHASEYPKECFLSLFEPKPALQYRCDLVLNIFRCGTNRIWPDVPFPRRKYSADSGKSRHSALPREHQKTLKSKKNRSDSNEKFESIEIEEDDECSSTASEMNDAVAEDSIGIESGNWRKGGSISMGKGDARPAIDPQSLIGANQFDSLIFYFLFFLHLVHDGLTERVSWIEIVPHLYYEASPVGLRGLLDDLDFELAMPMGICYHLGLRYRSGKKNPFQSILERGPPADDETRSAEFIKFWGKKRTAMRKFKDKNIFYCATWDDADFAILKTNDRSDIPEEANLYPSVKPALRHKLPWLVLCYLVKRWLVDYSNEFSSLDVKNFDWACTLAGDKIFSACVELPRINIPKRVYPCSTIYEASLHIENIWNKLKSVIQSQEGLPIAIKRLDMNGALGRLTDVSLPLYNPLLDLQGQAQFHRQYNAQLCPKSVPVVLVFENSSMWPEELEQIEKIRTAFYIRLRTLMFECNRVVSQLRGEECLEIFYGGYVFQLYIYYPKQVHLNHRLYRKILYLQRREESRRLLHEQLKKKNHAFLQREKHRFDKSLKEKTAPLNELVKKQRHRILNHFQRTLHKSTNRPSIPMENHSNPTPHRHSILPQIESALCRFEVEPKLNTLLRTFQDLNPNYVPACHLTKIWMSSHLIPLLHVSDGLLVDLLVASAFQPNLSFITRESVPNCPHSAFYRVLHHLAHLDPRKGPILIPLVDSERDFEEEELVLRGGSQWLNSIKSGWNSKLRRLIQKNWENIAEEDRPFLTLVFSDGSQFGARTNRPSDGDEKSFFKGKFHNGAKLRPGISILTFGAKDLQKSELYTTNPWRTDHRTAAAVWNRMRKLTLLSLNFISNGMKKFISENFVNNIFGRELVDFDVLIELDSSAITSYPNFVSCERGISGTICNFLDKSKNVFKTPVQFSGTKKVGTMFVPNVLTDFDPVRDYFDLLVARFADIALFFYEPLNSGFIGVLWKVDAFVLKKDLVPTFRVLPVTAPKNHVVGFVNNVVQLIQEMRLLGRGLVSNVRIATGSHKLRFCDD